VRTFLAIPLASLAALAVVGPVLCGEGPPATRAQIEQDLTVRATPLEGAKVRPGELVRLRAELVNEGTKRSFRVIDPGAGSELGLVEPFVYYSARFQPHEGDARTIEPSFPRGMCGMGDYRWLSRIRDLGPGESLEFGSHISSAAVTLDMKEPGRYELLLHYEFRRKGTTEKLPQSDPIGALGRMGSVPAFHVRSNPVVFDVVRPFEVFVEVTGELERGVPRPLSEVVTVRVENWTDAPVTLSNTRLRIVPHLVETTGHGRVERMPMDLPAIVLTNTLAPGEGLVVVGPGSAWFGEEWTPEDAGPVRLRVGVSGHMADAGEVVSHVVEIPVAKP